MPRGQLAGCTACGAVVHGKTRVRVGRNREGVFCAACLPAARERARERVRANARRWTRAIYLATRRAA
jgi:hypothetical protein